MDHGERDFVGAKIVLLLGRSMVSLQRDERSDIPWPGLWDLPGGGRDGDESAETCVIRETFEEVGVLLRPEHLIWRKFYVTPRPAWCFAARLDASIETQLRLGSEGQRVELFDPAEWVMRDDVVPHFRIRVSDAMEALLGG